MTQKKEYKICLISEQLASGGAERCAALLSQFFESKDIKVHHIIVIDKVDYEFTGELLNLGKIKSSSNTVFNRLKRFWVLRKYLQTNHFDFIIDFRVKNNQFQELITTRLLYKAPYVMTVHSYMTDLYFPKWHFLAKRIYSNALGIVTVSLKIKDKISSEYGYKNINTIYNPIAMNEILSKSEQQIELDFDYIISVGRMDDTVKQFDKLIMAYAESRLPIKKIKLVILGDGFLRTALQQQVKIHNLQDVIVFLGWQQNPFTYMKNANFTVLSSKNEGFGTVLIESLACATPVVAFDCLSGPSEIIQDRQNGLLVEDQNFEKLTQAMNLMIEDAALYQTCKQNAVASVQQFSLENIGKQWIEYLKIDVS
ncbi:MAG: glycosyltransferase [Flavobacteriaceae bacterium]|uniref:Glycosyltransferase n=1 Tax=Flavobacterium kayseriense TaxID=2764714 RepID=A0ABR7J6W4_9FLAO|nr:glycosyltransferase [Flavobacterium kayseriense]MBC5841202.1 glycosyltransferase [Flavobacterium kayseriense]MBC5847730.1 glycosyltransferase [Flavobacterium kayseriense]MBX9887551.1 glycosyltransferase [Flavobacteriaceae bacterium]